jgi:hypothetical protein
MVGPTAAHPRPRAPLTPHGPIRTTEKCSESEAALNQLRLNRLGGDLLRPSVVIGFATEACQIVPQVLTYRPPPDPTESRLVTDGHLPVVHEGRACDARGGETMVASHE